MKYLIDLLKIKNISKKNTINISKKNTIVSKTIKIPPLPLPTTTSSLPPLDI
jgi:hypothetical protein